MTIVARRPVDTEKLMSVVAHLKARGDANRPVHLRGVGHTADHAELRVRHAAQQAGCTKRLSLVVADVAWCDVARALQDERTAGAQAERIGRRAAILLSECRIRQLRQQAIDAGLLIAPHGKAKGGCGRGATYDLTPALRAVYAVDADASTPVSTAPTANTEPFTKRERRVSKPCGTVRKPLGHLLERRVQIRDQRKECPRALRPRRLLARRLLRIGSSITSPVRADRPAAS